MFFFQSILLGFKRVCFKFFAKNDIQHPSTTYRIAFDQVKFCNDPSSTISMPSRELYQKVKVEVRKAMQEPRADVMQLPHAIAETHQVCSNGQKKVGVKDSLKNTIWKMLRISLAWKLSKIQEKLSNFPPSMFKNIYHSSSILLLCDEKCWTVE